jgi:hypothetical protein
VGTDNMLSLYGRYTRVCLPRRHASYRYPLDSPHPMRVCVVSECLRRVSDSLKLVSEGLRLVSECLGQVSDCLTQVSESLRRVLRLAVRGFQEVSECLKYVS